MFFDQGFATIKRNMHLKLSYDEIDSVNKGGFFGCRKIFALSSCSSAKKFMRPAGQAINIDTC